jgi:asparaginyl-tRNA synthetase
LLMENIIDKVSSNPQKTKEYLMNICRIKDFPSITFDQAVNILIKNNKNELINFTSTGKDISSKGEIELMDILKLTTPIWITNYDRDRVPFYQKPDPNNSNKTINADLLFPPITRGAFGGEIVGSGQRQDDYKEMYDSLKRQDDIPAENYEWYINLRRNKNYKKTSGFGLGIERFITWTLGNNNIRDAILYPRLKNIKTYP